MKHLKYFSEINESQQGETEIIDFLLNSPEGNDIVRIGSSQFQPVRTGRVYCEGLGSKTYIDKTLDGYCFQSVSQGKIIGKECYPTLKECVRQLFINVVSKQISGMYGLKKMDMRNWVSSNIPTGMGLSMNEISQKYKGELGKQKVDVMGILNNSNAFKILNDVFDCKIEHTKDNPKYNSVNISYNLFEPFGIDICGYGERTRRTYADIRGTMTGKNGSKNNYGDLIMTLGDSDKAKNYFDRAISNDSIRRLSGGSESKSVFGIGKDFCQELIEMVKSIFSSVSSYEGEKSLDNILDSALIKLKNTNPVIFSSVIKKLESAGKFSEMTRKYRESDSDVIKGAGMMGRFMGNID